MTSLSEKQTDFIKNAVIKLGFKNIQIEINGKTEKGDGYMGIVQFLTVSDSEKTKNNKLHLVLKTAQSSEAFRQQAPIRKAYLREIYFYENIVPEFMLFQNEKSILKPFTGVVQFYGGLSLENQENLLLENIKQSGYQLWNRKVAMNSDHIVLVLQEYAKFHATSFAMRRLKPKKFDELTKNLVSIFEDTPPERLANMLKMEVQSAFEALGDKNGIAKKGLEKFAKEIGRVFEHDIKSPEDKLVVTHGDCWCNNMMFKYNDRSNPSKPTEMCFLDWQVSQIGSPLHDISYFFLASASIDVLNNSSKYLDIYYEALSENLRNFGCDPEEVFSYDLFMAHWKKYVKFGFYMGLVITKVLLGDSEDVPDLIEFAEDGKNVLEALHQTPRKEDIANAINQRLYDLIVFMTENNLF